MLRAAALRLEATMFRIWDVTARPAHYDWQQVPPVLSTPDTEGWEQSLREPGEDHGARRLPAGRRPRNAVDPYRRAVERDHPPSRIAVRTAADLMRSPVVFLHPGDLVEDAWELVRARRFRHVPILSGPGDAQPRLVGMVSDRDLLRVAGTPDRVPTDDVGARPLRTLMRSPVFSALPDTPVREVARVLFHEHIGSMPVCADDGELVGILTRTDILRALLTDGPLNLWI